MKQLSLLDTAYIAGIIDGEGCITVVRGRLLSHHQWTFSPRCSVSNTNQDLLDWLRDATRLGAFALHTKKRKRKQSYSWYLRTDEFVDFLQTIRPFLKIKGRQADIVLETIRLKERGNLLESELDYLNNLYHEVRALNERGDGS